MRRDLTTRWGRLLDPLAVLPEYPRPQLVRDSYLNLNGWWDYAVTPAAEPPPTRYDGRIVVPFSPEAPLSRVGRQLQPDERLSYRRTLRLPDGFRAVDDRVLLHFGAVDQTCTVRLNGVEVGANVGGYLPFSCDLTAALRPGDNELVVDVRDRSDGAQHARGKQRLHRGGIWYTAQSGIWQTVWLEAVPARARRGADPGAAPRGRVRRGHRARAGGRRWRGSLVDGPGAPGAGRRDGTGPARRPAPLDARGPVPARRQRRAGPGPGHAPTSRCGPSPSARTRTACRGCCSTGSRYPHVGVLDQGYWPDGLLTAPSDEAMVHDIATMKRLGFTVLRKHVKVEPLRWYAPLRPARDAGLAGPRERRRPLPHGRGDLAGEVPDPAARHPVALGDRSRRRGRPGAVPRGAAADRRAPAQRRVDRLLGAVQRGLGPVRRGRGGRPAARASTRPASSTTPAAGTTRAAATCAACTSTGGGSGSPAGRDHRAVALTRVRRPQPARPGPRVATTRSTSATATRAAAGPGRVVHPAARTARARRTRGAGGHRLHPAVRRGGRAERAADLRPRGAQDRRGRGAGGPGPAARLTLAGPHGPA